jgi:hypothetical protein
MKQGFGDRICKSINPSVRIFHTENYKRDFNKIWNWGFKIQTVLRIYNIEFTTLNSKE